jgi:hypothetical protein
MFGSASRKKTEEPAPAVVMAPAVDGATLRRREEAAYLRRFSVCLKLMDIGYQTNDAELQEVADQLAQRAFDVYMKRVANLPAVQGEGNLDEQLLHTIDDKTAGARLLNGRGTPATQQDARAGWGR